MGFTHFNRVENQTWVFGVIRANALTTGQLQGQHDAIAAYHDKQCFQLWMKAKGLTIRTMPTSVRGLIECV